MSLAYVNELRGNGRCVSNQGRRSFLTKAKDQRLSHLRGRREVREIHMNVIS